MTDRQLLISLAVSLSIHVMLIAAASHFFRSNQPVVLPLPIQRVELVEVEVLDPSKPFPPEPTPQPKAQNITAPKLLSKPQVSPTRRIPSTSNTDEQRKQVKKSEGEKPPLPGTSGSEPSQAAGDVGLSGDTHTADGIAIKGVSGGEASLDLGHGSKGDGTGGDFSSEKKSSTIARPLAGYQIKPRYPDSARQRAHRERRYSSSEF